MSECRVVGCGKQREGYSPFCATHRKRERRHGAALQATISAVELKPHREAVRRWLDGRPQANGWEPLRTLYRHLVEHSKAELERMSAQASPRCMRQSYDDILKVAAEGPAVADRAALETVSMYRLQQEKPRSFVSDDGFRVQLARRYRALSDVNVAETWSQTDGKVKRVYRDASARRLLTLGQFLAKGLGGLSLMILQTMAQEDSRVSQERRDAFAAVRASTATATDSDDSEGA